MKQIYIGSNKTILLSDNDFKWASQYSWEIVRSKKENQVRRVSSKNGKVRTFLLNNEIMKRLGKEFVKNDDEYVTFIDGNKFNFQRNNLVLIEKSLYHQRQPINGEWKGVRYEKRLEKYAISINLDKRFTRSTYRSSIAAAQDYNKLAVIYYGQFAAINNTSNSQVIWPPLVSPKSRRIRKPTISDALSVKRILTKEFTDVERFCPRCTKETCYLCKEGLKCLNCRWILSNKSTRVDF